MFVCLFYFGDLSGLFFFFNYSLEVVFEFILTLMQGFNIW